MKKLKFLFTNGLFNNPRTVLSRGTFERSHDLSSFANNKISAVINTSHLEILRKHIPDSNIVIVKNTHEAIKMLRDNKIQCVYSDYSPLRFWINKYNIPNVYVSYIETAAQQSGIGIRKDKPLLVSILNKAIKDLL